MQESESAQQSGDSLQQAWDQVSKLRGELQDGELDEYYECHSLLLQRMMVWRSHPLVQY